MYTYDFYSVTAVTLIFGPRRAKDAIRFHFASCEPQCGMFYTDNTRGFTTFNFPRGTWIREFMFNGVYVVVERIGDNYSIMTNTPVFTAISENVDGVLTITDNII